MNPESSTRPLKIKTCLTSFERYCDQNQRCQQQMSKLKKYFETTITRYQKKPFHSKSANQYRVEVNRSVNILPQRTQLQNIRVKHALKNSLDCEMIGITKAKLHSNNRIEKLKAQYTVPRKNVKSYIKMKKTSEYVGFKSCHQGNNFQETSRYSAYGKEYPRYRQVTNSTQMGEIIISLNKKEEGITQNEVERDTKTAISKRNTVRRNKVVYSSKGNTSFNRYKKEEVFIKNSNKTSRSKEVALTGWQTKEYDDCFGVAQTEHLKKVRQKTVL